MLEKNNTVTITKTTEVPVGEYCNGCKNLVISPEHYPKEIADFVGQIEQIYCRFFDFALLGIERTTNEGNKYKKCLSCKIATNKS